MTNPSDEKEPRDEKGSQAENEFQDEKPGDEQQLSKETVADLDASDEGAEAAKGGIQKRTCSK